MKTKVTTRQEVEKLFLNERKAVKSFTGYIIKDDKEVSVMSWTVNTAKRKQAPLVFVVSFNNNTKQIEVQNTTYTTYPCNNIERLFNDIANFLNL
jgi:hypothetical protein